MVPGLARDLLAQGPHRAPLRDAHRLGRRLRALPGGVEALALWPLPRAPRRATGTPHARDESHGTDDRGDQPVRGLTVHIGHEFLRNLALVLGIAAVTTVVFQKLRQPVVFGYMLAGLIIGPHVPIPLVADPDTVRTLSELGVILLMFSLGLEFSVRRLMKSGWSVVIIAVLESSLMLWLGYEAGRMLGWSVLGSLYAGAAIAISSTTIILKATAEQGARGRFMDLVFGILIIEDLIAIVLLALL